VAHIVSKKSMRLVLRRSTCFALVPIFPCRSIENGVKLTRTESTAETRRDGSRSGKTSEIIRITKNGNKEQTSRCILLLE
jgi:hypothetical protein